MGLPFKGPAGAFLANLPGYGEGGGPLSEERVDKKAAIVFAGRKLIIKPREPDHMLRGSRIAKGCIYEEYPPESQKFRAVAPIFASGRHWARAVEPP